MSYVVYHVETTKIPSLKKNPAYGIELYKSETSAKRAILNKSRRDASFNPLEYRVADYDNFTATIEKDVVRHGVGLAHGKTFKVKANTPWATGPWSDAYWQN